MGERIAVIGGTALRRLQGVEKHETVMVATPYGDSSVQLHIGKLSGREVVFLARHGDNHTIAPHKINYRANIWALNELEVKRIIAIATVGGISEKFSPGTLAIPNQLIDYTCGRSSSFHEDSFSIENHIEFAEPYDSGLRDEIYCAASDINLNIVNAGTMAITQGPRLETAAEIKRLAGDGCDLVGMTGMPEAVLARELNIPYVALAIVVNWAAGIVEGVITIDEIKSVLANVEKEVCGLLIEVIRNRQ